MNRRELLKSIPLMTVAPALGAVGSSQSRADHPGAGQAPRSAGTAAAPTRYPLSMLCIGLWVFGWDDDAVTYYLAAVNAKDTPIPEAGPNEHVHEHKAVLVLPADTLIDAGAGMEVDAVDRRRWPWLPTAVVFRKFPLGVQDAQFHIKGVEETVDENVYAAFPIRQANRGHRIKPQWYKERDNATAWLYQLGGTMRDAPPRKPVKVKWTFDYERGRPGTDTPVRLTDTLELFGSGSAIEIDPGGGPVNKRDVPINGYLVNLPDDVSLYERQHKTTLFHIRAFYKAFETRPPVNRQRIPWTTAATYPGGEPVFCPPGSLI
jgi:hypothetical protein